MSKIYNKYLELKSIDKDKLYLFKSGKFYIFIADDCDKINDYIVLKKVKFTNNIFKCGFPENALNDYMRVFKNQKLNIEIIEDITLNEKNINDFILDIDINKISPLEALNILNEIKEKIKNEERNR